MALAAEPRSFDLIVVGSGIAGLYAALLAKSHGRVLLVSKSGLEESNTRYAQGGIAVALAPTDSPDLHFRDTIAAGDGLCDDSAVAVLTREAPDCIVDLLGRGVPFDREGDDLAWTLEAAHSRPRILHAGGDATGASVERTLVAAIRESDVTVLERAFCRSLIMAGGRVAGIELIREDGSVRRVPSPRVLLATGGAGQLYARTTNPAVATGDGLALAYRAGAQLMDLEFMQFHPTALALDGAPSFLISEAVRGEGGILRDCFGRPFMADYHPDRELAPRDVVARAIHHRMTATGGPVSLDVTHLDRRLVERRFPSILAFCRRVGIDPVAEPIPVAPAAHYLMGGIRTDLWARTSVPGLFACGEVACTAVHGANRLASNSLLEGLVFARRAIHGMLHAAPDVDLPEGMPVISPLGGTADAPAVSRAELTDAMWRHAGLVRTADSLHAVQGRLATDSEPLPGNEPSRAAEEMRNLELLARLTIASALCREESRGGHYRSDYPRRDGRWAGHLLLSPTGMEFLPLVEAPVGVAAGV